LYSCLKRILYVLLWTSILSGTNHGQAPLKSENYALMPYPASLTALDGRFIIDEETSILVDNEPGVISIAEELAAKFKLAAGFSIPIRTDRSGSHKNFIRLNLEPLRSDLGEEGYQLEVTRAAIHLAAATAHGLFYGWQTIRQLLPPQIERSEPGPPVQWSIPALKIIDNPRFRWRGMLLDCGRHFMDKEFVKRYIDLLAYHKMNVLHWHLTEDQGWRIQIRKYPKLTEVGAWRTEEDGSVYGGYYTQEDIREVVAYAEKRFVTVVPEIELPGHSVAALASYPQFSCTGGPFEVETRWGVHADIYCAGNDSTFTFLEDVFTEVLELFPSGYIHIGGDEAPKKRWQNCSKCQQRIKTEAFKDEHELQSYFIRRIETFLNQHGRRIIGWDEILEGGLAPNATVQSWRGMDGAIAAVRAGHNAIVSPTSHAYLDADVATVDLRKVYSFEPIPHGLNEEEAALIMGGECNMWTERAPQERVDSKVFPRILAMSERLWSPKSLRNFIPFHNRVQAHYPRLDLLGVRYGAESKPVHILAEFDSQQLQCRVNLQAGEPGLDLYYTLDGNSPDALSTHYKNAVLLTSRVELKAQAFRQGKPYGEMSTFKFQPHKALGKPLTSDTVYHAKYPGGGSLGLVNGIRGSKSYLDGRWQGYEEIDLSCIIDLGDLQQVSSVSAGFLQDIVPWIFLPESMGVLLSTDGKEFKFAGRNGHTISQKKQSVTIEEISVEFEPTPARYVKIQAKSVGRCPEWHPGAGGKAWIFVDEIIVN